MSMKPTTFAIRRHFLGACLCAMGLGLLTQPLHATSISVGTTKNVPLALPEPHHIEQKLTEAQVRDIIVEIATRLHWRILCQIMPNEVRMVYLRGDRLEMDVNVRYSAKEFRIEYLGSRGLYEEKLPDGSITLSPKGNHLLADLDRVITRRLTSGLPAPSEFFKEAMDGKKEAGHGKKR